MVRERDAPVSIPGMSTVGDNALNFASSVIQAALCLLYTIPSAPCLKLKQHYQDIPSFLSFVSTTVDLREKRGGGVTCIPERKSDNSKETATCTKSDRFPDFF